MNSVNLKNLSLKSQKLAPPGCKDKVFRKFTFFSKNLVQEIFFNDLSKSMWVSKVYLSVILRCT